MEADEWQLVKFWKWILCYVQVCGGSSQKLRIGLPSVVLTIPMNNKEKKSIKKTAWKNQPWSRSECETGYTIALSCAGWGARAEGRGKAKGTRRGWCLTELSSQPGGSGPVKPGTDAPAGTTGQGLSRKVVPRAPREASHSLLTTNRP